MALEDRVKQLEDEIKVLKNEIQTTLLDIQAQVLSHYYPTLYSSLNNEEPLSTKSVNSPAQEQIVSPFNGIHSRYKTKTITLVEETEVDPDDSGQDSNQSIDPNVILAVPAPSPDQKPSLSPPHQNGNTPEQVNQLINPSKSDLPPKNVAYLDKNPLEENNRFNDNLATAQPDEDEEAIVSFDELGELLQNKVNNSDYRGDPLTGEILDDLFDESFPFLDGSSEINLQSDSTSLNSQAVKVTVRKLMSWVEECVTTIGKTRSKQAIDMYVKTGDLTPEMNNTLRALVDSQDQPLVHKQADIKQVINTLGKLNDILDHHTHEYLVDVMSFISEVNFG